MQATYFERSFDLQTITNTKIKERHTQDFCKRGARIVNQPQFEGSGSKLPQEHFIF